MQIYIEVVSKPQIMFESKAQADNKAQHTCEVLLKSEPKRTSGHDAQPNRIG
jgi:hypothetical protein